MDFQQYMLYVTIASLTIASPGPGVILSVTNAIKYGSIKTLPSIFGIALGIFSIACIAASGVGIVILSSAIAFSFLKIAGAFYLIYLGVKLWRSKEIGFMSEKKLYNKKISSSYQRFKEGLFITLANPKPIVFFIALFPQFITTQSSYLYQFLILSISFCLLIILIHTLYALFSQFMGQWTNGKIAGTIINKISGTCFFGFAAAIFASKS